MEEISTKFYSFSALSIKGNNIDMSSYKGKLLLVVNTASECGLTPQYAGLESLHRKYKEDGLVILGFPCNQFGQQEPGDETSIQKGCLINYDVTFQMFAKIHVNGRAAHPIYKYLKKELSGIFGRRIKWNFTKFLIDRNGIPLKRFAPTDKPAKIDGVITEILRNEGK